MTLNYLTDILSDLHVECLAHRFIAEQWVRNYGTIEQDKWCWNDGANWTQHDYSSHCCIAYAADLL